MFKKGITGAIVLLLLGFALASSVQADVIDESDGKGFVDVVTEVYTVDGVQHDVIRLTSEDAIALEAVFRDLQVELEQGKNRAEHVRSVNEGVVRINELGLLPEGVSLGEAQQIITMYSPRSLIDEQAFRLFQGTNPDSNLFCMIAGETNHTLIVGPVSTVGFMLINGIGALWTIFHNLGLELLAELIVFGLGFPLNDLLIVLVYFLSFLFPAFLGGSIAFGEKTWESPDSEVVRYPADGWVWTQGVLGERQWNGSFWGQIRTGSVSVTIGRSQFHFGASGFTGIRFRVGADKQYFLGSALRVKIGSNDPDP